ncbi:hypothetical protein BX666DRAFT_1115734 [Dichotomocladium elegans]|nr:hypothetical protein BX666DRAFT_1115734 [Dichotomocladium elegans]
MTAIPFCMCALSCCITGDHAFFPDKGLLFPIQVDRLAAMLRRWALETISLNKKKKSLIAHGNKQQTSYVDIVFSFQTGPVIESMPYVAVQEVAYKDSPCPTNTPSASMWVMWISVVG